MEVEGAGWAFLVLGGWLLGGEDLAIGAAFDVGAWKVEMAVFRNLGGGYVGRSDIESTCFAGELLVIVAGATLASSKSPKSSSSSAWNPKGSFSEPSIRGPESSLDSPVEPIRFSICEAGGTDDGLLSNAANRS